MSQQKELYNWFDIENAWLQYATAGKRSVGFLTTNDFVERNKAIFQSLTESLTRYLSDELKKPIDKGSYAAQVLRAVIEHPGCIRQMGRNQRILVSIQNIQQELLVSSHPQ